MKSQKNLVIAFILGLIWMGSMFVYGMLFAPSGTISTVMLPQFVILLALVLAIFVFAVRSIVRGESKVGAVIVILADFILLFISFLLYFGIDL